MTRNTINRIWADFKGNTQTSCGGMPLSESQFKEQIEKVKGIVKKQ